MKPGILSFYRGEEEIRKVTLDREMMIGRGQDCAIRLDDHAISRQHLRLVPSRDGKVQLENRSHFSPVYVNGKECTSAILKTGDLVELGPFSFRVQTEEPREEVTPQQPVVEPEKKEELEPAPPPTVDEILAHDEVQDIGDLGEVGDDLMGAGSPEIELDGETSIVEPEEYSSLDPLDSIDVLEPIDPVESAEPPDLKGDWQTKETEEPPIESSVPPPAPPKPATPEISRVTASFLSNGMPKKTPEKELSLEENSAIEVESISRVMPQADPVTGSRELELGSIKSTSDVQPEEVALPILGNGPEEDPIEAPDLAMPTQSQESNPQPEVIENATAILKGEAVQNLSSVSSFPSQSLPGTSSRTKVTSGQRIRVLLIFGAGDANVTEYEIRTPEVVIGRSKNCDIVLEDKKASRKNTIIRRAGVRFLIKDLDSVNGTYVNGIRVTEQKLTGDDRIQIGDTEFQFKAVSVDYENQKDAFPSISSSVSQDPIQGTQSANLGLAGTQSMLGPPPTGPGQVETWSTGAIQQPVVSGGQALPGFLSQPVGIENPGGGGGGGAVANNSLLGRYRALPQRKRIIYLITVGALIWMGLDEFFPESSGPPVVTEKKAEEKKGVKTFASLKAEEKEFVERQYTLAFDLYRKKEYDQALFELRKIFKLIPDYKAAREIEQYAEDGKARLKAIQEEIAKKGEEAKIKKRVTELEGDVSKLMARRDFKKAQLLFAEILALDPENERVGQWRNQIAAVEEEKQRKAIEREAQAAINQNAWKVYEQGVALKEAENCFEAIRKFRSVKDLGASDPKLLRSVDKGIQDCRGRMIAMTEPLVKDAIQLEQEGSIKEAFQRYEEATRIDPENKEALGGIDRIREVLHEMAKILYTEAVIAESYSDFEEAKKKYEECLETVPKDDVYYQRAERKLRRYRPFRVTAEAEGEGETQVE